MSANNQALREAIAARDGAQCAHCGRAGTVVWADAEDPYGTTGVGLVGLTLDHITPGAGDDEANLQLLCFQCNAGKGHSTEDKTVRYESGLLQAGFTMVPNLVLLDPSLTPQGHRLYGLLHYYARQSEECWPGQDRLADVAGMSERAVRGALRLLEQFGLVRTRRRGRGQTNVYVLLTPRPTRPAGRAVLAARAAPGAAVERHDVPEKKKTQLEEESPVPAVPAANSQKLVAHYVDEVRRFGGAAPERVVGQVAREVQKLILEGYAAPVLARALSLMAEKGKHPSTLPSFVVEAQVQNGNTGLSSEDLLQQAQEAAANDRG